MPVGATTPTCYAAVNTSHALLTVTVCRKSTVDSRVSLVSTIHFIAQADVIA